jgi:biotin carboxyl carrier protein
MASLMKKLNYRIIALILLLSEVSCAAGEIISIAVPGGAVVLPLSGYFTTSPQVFFQGQRVMVIAQQGKAYAVVGISLSTKPGKYQIHWQKSQAELIKQSFTIHAKSYPTQYLTIKNKRKVKPNPTDLKRIEREQVVINKIKNTWTDTLPLKLQFNWPLQGRISSAFGLQRFYNGEPRAPHAGLDIAAPMGSPIRAPASGQVIGTGNFFFSGNTVYLDHGQGLISMYGHMSKINVQVGQQVKPGTVLGLVGQTGRATGPHLHWSIILNKAMVDPELFVAKAVN